MNRPSLFLLLAIALLPISCSKKVSTTSNVTPEALSGEWQIVSIEGDTLPIVAEEEIPSIQFDIEENSFSCYVGCNRMGGSLSISKDSIKLGNIFSTRMLCPDKMQLEQKCGVALDKVSLASMTNDDKIILQDKNGTALITLERISK